jgi:hypothetical protein
LRKLAAIFAGLFCQFQTSGIANLEKDHSYKRARAFSRIAPEYATFSAIARFRLTPEPWHQFQVKDAPDLAVCIGQPADLRGMWRKEQPMTVIAVSWHQKRRL